MIHAPVPQATQDIDTDDLDTNFDDGLVDKLSEAYPTLNSKSYRQKDLYAERHLLLEQSKEDPFEMLEAMAAGAPVISSNVYSIPEVAGGAARLIDPGSQAELDLAVSEVALDQPLRSELRARGLENVNRFSWDRCAAQTAAIYHSVRR